MLVPGLQDYACACNRSQQAMRGNNWVQDYTSIEGVTRKGLGIVVNTCDTGSEDYDPPMANS